MMIGHKRMEFTELKNKRIVEIGREIPRLHSAENPHWERLWTCHKRD